MTAIHITGAGGCIDNETTIIAETLRRLGFQVEVDDPYGRKLDFDETCEHVKKYNAGSYGSYDIKCGPLKVKITTTHVPWGG